MLELKKLSKYYHDKQTVVKALDDISLTFENNEFVVITGESGSGKSTLLNVISGLDSYEDGEMFFMNQETSYFTFEDWERYRKNHIGFIFQHYNLIESYTVYQNIDIASTIAHPHLAAREKTVMQLIEKVGLKGKEKQKASTLSGGEKQRVAIARALAKDAPIIIADEPTGNLDQKTSKTILELLKDISKDKLVLLVSHSYETTKAYATRHIRLADGEVISDDKKRQKQTPVQKTDLKSEQLNFKDLFFIGIKNLLATPKKTMFTLFVALFVVGTFALIYGAYVQQANTESSLGGFRYFENPNRIMVTNRDLSAFSEADLAYFESLDGVQTVLPYDTILGLRAYVQIIGDGYQFFYDGFFNHPKTIQNSDISAGRLPQNSNEVIVRMDEFDLGDTIKISIEIPMRFGEETDIRIYEFEVVGKLTGNPYPPVIYPHADFFEDDVIRAFGLFMHQETIFFPYNSSLGNISPSLSLNNELEADEIIISQYLARQIKNDGFDGDNLVVGDTITMEILEKLSLQPIEADFTIKDISEDLGNYGVHISLSEEGLVHLFDDVKPHQISLMVFDSFDANRVLDQLEEVNVHSLYPAGISDPLAQIGQAIMNLFLGFLSVIVLFVMYFIGYMALKNVMEAKRKDYVILRSIGLFKKDLNRLSILEILMVMFLAIFIAMIALIINANIYAFLPNYLRYYQWGNYLFLAVLLLIMSVFLALRFNQRIFSRSVITAFKDQG